MADIARLAEVIDPEVKAMGLALVRVKMIGSEAGEGEPALQVMAEDPATGQLVLDQCAALSHRISDRLDALEEAGEVLVKGAYRLEVSSPGIDRPLTRLGDFSEWAGHEAKVSLSEKVAVAAGELRDLRGDIVGVEGDLVAIDDRKNGRVSFPFSHIHSAKLVLTDRLLAAARPLDMSGADEIEGGTEEILEEEEG